ncbi:hypothetical protein H696_02520 [Fonticula alba]|uniref:Uncharacterized protein n=1 Tax=Fonticula alba TaxID=691883 RepID=A0A058ZCB1_FONAL|nr:hypothetical protein H696_02520 [Fonticula alba]KCV71581.1 hypothetical protein H696_02520 [Fonticula alba]|eukprot:XP_009494704.1 hypothetical protein H696_02520 [Fonticula alba]
MTLAPGMAAAGDTARPRSTSLLSTSSMASSVGEQADLSFGGDSTGDPTTPVSATALSPPATPQAAGSSGSVPTSSAASSSSSSTRKGWKRLREAWMLVSGSPGSGSTSGRSTPAGPGSSASGGQGTVSGTGPVAWPPGEGGDMSHPAPGASGAGMANVPGIFTPHAGLPGAGGLLSATSSQAGLIISPSELNSMDMNFRQRLAEYFQHCLADRLLGQAAPADGAGFGSLPIMLLAPTIPGQPGPSDPPDHPFIEGGLSLGDGHLTVDRILRGIQASHYPGMASRIGVSDSASIRSGMSGNPIAMSHSAATLPAQLSSPGASLRSSPSGDNISIHSGMSAPLLAGGLAGQLESTQAGLGLYFALSSVNLAHPGVRRSSCTPTGGAQVAVRGPAAPQSDPLCPPSPSVRTMRSVSSAGSAPVGSKMRLSAGHPDGFVAAAAAAAAVTSSASITSNGSNEAGPAGGAPPAAVAAAATAATTGSVFPSVDVPGSLAVAAPRRLSRSSTDVPGSPGLGPSDLHGDLVGAVRNLSGWPEPRLFAVDASLTLNQALASVIQFLVTDATGVLTPVGAGSGAGASCLLVIAPLASATLTSPGQAPILRLPSMSGFYLPPHVADSSGFNGPDAGSLPAGEPRKTPAAVMADLLSSPALEFDFSPANFWTFIEASLEEAGPPSRRLVHLFATPYQVYIGSGFEEASDPSGSGPGATTASIQFFPLCAPGRIRFTLVNASATNGLSFGFEMHVRDTVNATGPEHQAGDLTADAADAAATETTISLWAFSQQECESWLLHLSTCQFFSHRLTSGVMPVESDPHTPLAVFSQLYEGALSLSPKGPFPSDGGHLFDQPESTCFSEIFPSAGRSHWINTYSIERSHAAKLRAASLAEQIAGRHSQIQHCSQKLDSLAQERTRFLERTLRPLMIRLKEAEAVVANYAIANDARFGSLSHLSSLLELPESKGALSIGPASLVALVNSKIETLERDALHAVEVDRAMTTTRMVILYAILGPFVYWVIQRIGSAVTGLLAGHL